MLTPIILYVRFYDTLPWWTAIQSMVCMAMAVLLIHQFVKGDKKEKILASFGVLPMVAGMTDGIEAVKLAVFGGLVFGILDLMVNAMTKRIAMAGICKCAVIPSAFVMYLAFQCFTGIVL